MPVANGAIRELLLDPAFWRPRLDRLDREPRSLVVVPRPDLARPGAEAVELRLRAHDGRPLRALLARPTWLRPGSRGARGRRPCGATIHVRLDVEPDWRIVEAGEIDLALGPLPHRRLEDRVLDVLRAAEAARSVQCGEEHELDLRGAPDRPHDELALAALLYTRWRQDHGAGGPPA